MLDEVERWQQQWPRGVPGLTPYATLLAAQKGKKDSTSADNQS